MKHYPPNGEPTTTNQHCQPLITNPKPTKYQPQNHQTPIVCRLRGKDLIGGGSGFRNRTGGGNLEGDVCERRTMICINGLYQNLQLLTLSFA